MSASSWMRPGCRGRDPDIEYQVLDIKDIEDLNEVLDVDDVADKGLVPVDVLYIEDLVLNV